MGNDRLRNRHANSPRWPWWIGYVVSVLVVAVLTFVLKALFPVFPLGRYPIPYIVLIMAVAHLFGEGPAILTFMLGVFAFDYYFVEPAGTIMPHPTGKEAWAQFLAFLLGTAIVGFATLLMRRHRRRTEWLAEELRESEEEYRRLYQEAPLAYFTVGIDGLVRRANRSAAAMLGYALDDLIGRPVFDLYADTPAGKDRARQVFSLFSAGQEVHGQELQMRRSDGTPVWISLTVLPAFDPQGHVVESRSMAEDISGRKRAEQDLIRLRDEADRASIAAVEARDTAQRQSLLLQRALLPAKPAISAGYRIASRYLAGSAGEEIGGDFYDVVETETGKVAILIGDVSGKGVEAAALAAASRGTLRAFAYDTSAPGDSMTHANAVICAQQEQQLDPAFAGFVTVFLAVVDPPTGDIRYCSAGHPPAAVYHAATGEVEFLRYGHPPVGVFAEYQFGESDSRLSLGDRVVFYTDGVNEARRDSEMFGLEGIERVLKEHGRLPPEDIVGELVAAASSWAGGRFTDDVAAIVVERQG